MEMFSEFLGQAGCLVGLGDLTATGVYSKDVRSHGGTQGTRLPHQHHPSEMRQPGIPPTSPRAQGSDTTCELGSVVAGAHYPPPLPR